MITGVLLVSSTSLFVASVTSGAPELVSTVFAFGIVAYAIVYPPWGGPDSEGRDRRSRIAAVSVFAAFCVAIGISALQMTASLYGVGETGITCLRIVGVPVSSRDRIDGVGRMSFILWHGICRYWQYARAGLDSLRGNYMRGLHAAIAVPPTRQNQNQKCINLYAIYRTH